MKYLILPLVILFLIFIIWRFKKSPSLREEIVVEKTKIVEVIDRHLDEIIDKVNKRNNDIISLKSEVVVYVQGQKIYSEIYYHKDKDFRMFFYDFVGLNLDIGSNENQFWFWSKNYDKKTLFVAKHEDYYKTRLKTPFNPIWIMDSLAIRNISTDDCKLEENDQFIKISKKDYSSLGSIVKKVIVIDKDKNRIVGNYVYSALGNLLVSSEWIDGMLKIKWLEENQTMLLKFDKWEVNKNVDGMFVLPVKKREVVDMGKM